MNYMYLRFGALGPVREERTIDKYVGVKIAQKIFWKRKKEASV